MKLLPDSLSSKCGLLNYLTNINTTRKSIFIPENAQNGFLDRIQTLANCEKDSDWPSSNNDPSVTFQLYNYHIRPLFISLTRRWNFSYPERGVLQGLEYNGWVNICRFDSISIDSDQTRVYECRSNNINSYSTLRFMEIKRENQSLKYLELNSFDIFGKMIYDFATLSISHTNHHKYFIMLVLGS